LTGEKDVRVLSYEDGTTIHTFTSQTGIRDVVTMKNNRYLVTEQEQWVDHDTPKTTMTVRKGEDGSEQCHTQADNCADEVVLSDDESHAFLAPTMCEKDPVSVMSIKDSDCRVERQMPGFGPVAKSPDGTQMVAFLDRDQESPGVELPAEVRGSATRYHL